MSPDPSRRFTRVSSWWTLLPAACCLLFIARPAAAAGLLVAEGGLGGVLKIKSQEVKVTINNGVAVTQVDQVFLNTENRIVEALYTFPVPQRGSVVNFSMWINGREMIGEVLEKQRARQIYESYKQVKRDPGLLEQVDYKRFEMRIFPIAAGAEQHVRVTYCQELDFDHDAATYVFPLATVTDRRADSRTTGHFSLTFELKSETPVVELTSPSHPDQFAILKRDNVGYYQAALEVKEGDLNRDVVLSYQLSRPKTGIDLITSRTGREDGYFLLTMTAGKELEDVAGGSDYVFVLDVSGSMAVDGKLTASRSSVSAFTNALDKNDRFDVIAFNIAANPLYSKLATPSEETRDEVDKFLASQRAVGGTVLRPALEAAYRYVDEDRPLNVVILSDGMTEQNEQRQLIDLIAKRPSQATVFCVGVGNEVNRPLLSQLAEDAGGLAAFISQGDDFQRQAQAFRRKLTRPAAKNVKITFDGGEVYDVEPQTLANLYHGQPLRMLGRYRQTGPAKVRVQAEVLGTPLDQTVDVILPDRDDANPEIERMWASYRVDRLMGDDRRTGSRGNLDEIVRLCEGYSIAGEYASFIVLENDAEYKRWQIDRRNATRVERDRTAQRNLRNQLDQLREMADRKIGPVDQDEVAMADTSSKRPSSNASPQPSPTNQVAPARSPSTGRDLQVPSFSRRNNGGGGGGGGGPIDPLTALAACVAIGLGYAVQRRRAA